MSEFADNDKANRNVLSQSLASSGGKFRAITNGDGSSSGETNRRARANSDWSSDTSDTASQSAVGGVKFKAIANTHSRSSKSAAVGVNFRAIANCHDSSSDGASDSSSGETNRRAIANSDNSSSSSDTASQSAAVGVNFRAIATSNDQYEPDDNVTGDCCFLSSMKSLFYFCVEHIVKF